MNDFIKINGKYYKEHSIIIPELKEDDILITASYKLYNNTRLANREEDVPFRIYFISDDVIKPEDVALNMYNKKYTLFEIEMLLEDGYVGKKPDNEYFEYGLAKTLKKVIATDDPLGEDYINNSYRRRIQLPRPSNDFIHSLQKQYNKGNKFDKVLIEYEKCYTKQDVGPDLEYFNIKVAKDNTISIADINKKYNSKIQKVLNYLYENRYNETNPMLYSYVSSLI